MYKEEKSTMLSYRINMEKEYGKSIIKIKLEWFLVFSYKGNDEYLSTKEIINMKRNRGA